MGSIGWVPIWVGSRLGLQSRQYFAMHRATRPAELAVAPTWMYLPQMATDLDTSAAASAAAAATVATEPPQRMLECDPTRI